MLKRSTTMNFERALLNSVSVSKYATETKDYLEELYSECYAVEDMLQFIDTHGEQQFRDFYVQYVNYGEKYEYKVVDEFIAIFGINSLNDFPRSYRGSYKNMVEFAEELFDEIYWDRFQAMTSDFPPCVIKIDYETYAEFLDNDGFYFSNGYVFQNI